MGPSSVRDATFDVLRARGMTTVFGNPGSTELGFLSDFPTDFRYVLGLHEGVAVAMADGYAQATGRPAFVNLHSACGVGNAMGAVVNAFHNRAPLVITAGNQDRRHLESEPYLFARSAELMAPYVKHASQPARAQDVPVAIKRAWALAQSPPAGPAFVSIPMDDWSAPAAPATAAGGELRFGGTAAAATLDAVATRLTEARRPVIVAGAGIDRAGAWESATRLAERLGAAVWAAPQSPRAGFPEDHPGFCGHLAPAFATARRQLGNADVVLVLGAPVFAFLAYEPGAEPMPPLIHVTDDPDEAARSDSALAVIADVGAVLAGLLDRLPATAAAAPPPAALPPPAAPPASQPIPPAFLMATLASVLPADAIVVEEAPSHRGGFRRHVRIRRAGGFFATASGGLGFAMPAAVGIALAGDARPVVCVVGDGSALYAPQALWSAVQLRLAITFVVVDNGRYAILEAAAVFAGHGGLPSMALPGIDLVALARSFGCPARRITDPADVRPALTEALAGNAPSLLAVAVDPAAAPLLGDPRVRS